MNVTEEDVSHTVLCFPDLQIVVHSNLLGLHIESIAGFVKHSEVVYSVDIKSKEGDTERLMSLLAEYEWSMYDYGALIFLGLTLALRRYLKIPLPKSNLWQSSGMFLCVGWITKYVFDKEDDMITPYKLYRKLDSCKNRL